MFGAELANNRDRGDVLPEILISGRKSIAVNRKSNRYAIFAGGLFLAFLVFTLLMSVLDVRPIGPDGSEVGFAAINSFVHQKIGVHMLWYHMTDRLGLIAVLFGFGFAAVGLIQLVASRSLRNVERSILCLGVTYTLLFACYIFFEQIIINYRPVLIEGVLEASYPSSHTMLVVCVMITAAKEIHILCPSRRWLCRGTDVFCRFVAVVTVIGRLLSGVHWFTDIIGGLLLASALIALYSALAEG